MLLTRYMTICHYSSKGPPFISGYHRYIVTVINARYCQAKLLDIIGTLLLWSMHGIVRPNYRISLVHCYCDQCTVLSGQTTEYHWYIVTAINTRYCSAKLLDIIGTLLLWSVHSIVRPNYRISSVHCYCDQCTVLLGQTTGYHRYIVTVINARYCQAKLLDIIGTLLMWSVHSIVRPNYWISSVHCYCDQCTVLSGQITPVQGHTFMGNQFQLFIMDIVETPQ